MPGANYMGGRRNIVKARAKDAVSRQQKSHFGRQRLDILARGVSALKPSELAHARPSAASITYRPGAQDIDLAHARARARTKLPVESGGDKVQKRYIPSPVHVLPSLCSPRSRASMRAPSAPENTKKARSALCDALDMSDPVFMRRIMDEILAMPDLAGLARCKQKSNTGEQPVTMTRSPRARSAIDSSPGSQSQGASHSSKQQSSRQRPETSPSFRNSVHNASLSDYDTDFGHHPRASSIRSPSTPYAPHTTRIHQHSPDSLGADFKHKISPSSGVSDTGKGSSHQPKSFSTPRSFHDSGFSEYNAWSDPRAVGDSSPSWSTRFNNTDSSPRSAIRFPEVEDGWTEDTRECEGEYPADSGFHSDALAIATGIPTVIEFGQQRLQRQGSGDRPSVYGALFEQQDPWQAIGVILGIEEQGKRSDVNIPLPRIDTRRTGVVDVEVPLDVDHNQLFEEEFGNVAVENMSCEEDENELDMGWDCQFSILSKVGQSGLEQSPVEIPLEDWGPTQISIAHHETMKDTGSDSEPMIGLGDGATSDGMLVDGENEHKMFGIDDDTCDGTPLDELQEGSEMDLGRVLKVPALDEVDGKFVGPALFGRDFSSSEDE